MQESFFCLPMTIVFSSAIATDTCSILCSFCKKKNCGTQCGSFTKVCSTEYDVYTVGGYTNSWWCVLVAEEVVQANSWWKRWRGGQSEGKNERKGYAYAEWSPTVPRYTRCLSAESSPGLSPVHHHCSTPKYKGEFNPRFMKRKSIPHFYCYMYAVYIFLDVDALSIYVKNKWRNKSKVFSILISQFFL
jgi:hypothetical protein